MDKLKRAMLPVITFAIIDVKRLFRDKVAIFFVFVFPLIFLIIFGGIFGADRDMSFQVGILNNSNSEFSNQFVQQIKDNQVFDVDEAIVDMETASQKMSRGQISATIVLPEGFGDLTEAGYPGGNAEVLYSQNNEQAALTLQSILQAVFSEINDSLVPTVQPFTVSAESTSTAGLRSFDYVFSGILGFTLLSLGIFGPTTVFPRLKQRGVLRRYKTTSLKVWQYFTANVISNSIVGLLALVLMFASAVMMFGLNMRGSYINLAIVVLLGTVLLFGIGLAVGGWAKNENQAAPLAQLVTLPMMFLSGVFFPTFLMPEVLQKITQYIPLTPIIDSIRLVITENTSLLDLGPQMLVMGVWIVAIYFIAFKVFRWE